MIYLKLPKDFLKIFATFVPESFLENLINLSENFAKNLVKISIKFSLKTVQILVIVVYPKFPENFLFFVEFSQIFIKISSHFNIFRNQSFQKCSQKFTKVFFNICDFFKFFIKFYRVFLKFFSKYRFR